jgi:TatA/E family protein of Tat protein translocase
MFDIGLQEMLVVGVLALLVFGPEKLPELGRKLGRAMREFRRASDEFRSTVETNLQMHEDIMPPAASYTDPVPAAVTSTEPPAPGEPPAGAEPAAEPVAATVPGVGGEGSGDGLLDEPYWTTRGGKLLHRRTCAWRRRFAADTVVPIKALADGWDQGLQGCPVCDPRESAVPS